MSKREITPKVILTTQDYPDVMRREYTLTYSFELQKSFSMRDLLRLDLFDIAADLEQAMHNAISEWASEDEH